MVASRVAVIDGRAAREGGRSRWRTPGRMVARQLLAQVDRSIVIHHSGGSTILVPLVQLDHVRD
jgi:hypothetical protein